MYITNVHIENFKGFRKFDIPLNKNLNILVGDNEAGKSTILEAIHLALTGLYNGRYLKNDLSQYLFNNESVEEYLGSLKKDSKEHFHPPYILIELCLEGKGLVEFEGNGNSDKKNNCGIAYKIAFNESFSAEYEQLVETGTISSIPIEYYDVEWSSFARDSVTSRSIPLKSALIDSASNRYQNGSDIYISRIIQDFLEKKEVVDVAQAHRKMRDVFMEDSSIININEKIKQASKISNKEIKISVDLSSKNAWENSLMTYLDNVPFHCIGKGEQCIVKTKLALGHKKSQEANVILIEEPENHLSHTKLSNLISDIQENGTDKQIIISTHSSFVANKLGLESLILLNNKMHVRLNELPTETNTFFKKLAGYNTLRLVLCKSAILVEGDSDELVVQKAYMTTYDGNLPIERGIDVISVGTAFLRFLEIANKINKKVKVVTDNDGNVSALETKYKDYLGTNKKENIEICFDGVVDSGSLKINDKPFNYNTLEPKLIKLNSLATMNKVLGKDFQNVDDLYIYMHSHKVDCAFKIFETSEEIKFPEYIIQSVK